VTRAERKKKEKEGNGGDGGGPFYSGMAGRQRRLVRLRGVPRGEPGGGGRRQAVAGGRQIPEPVGASGVGWSVMRVCCRSNRGGPGSPTSEPWATPTWPSA
jgi:hypothetical protein